MCGCEWVIEAHGCDAAALADLAKLRALFNSLTEALFLHPVGDATFHTKFSICFWKLTKVLL